MQYERLKNGYIIRLVRGEEIHAALNRFIQERAVPGGSITGIGAIENARLGYYDLGDKKYIDKTFEGEYELLSLTGNIAWLEDKPIVHAHVVLSDTGMEVVGGHLFEATVAVTVEVCIHLAEGRLQRGIDKETGLNLLQLNEKQPQ